MAASQATRKKRTFRFKNPLLSFDANRYVLLDAVPFANKPQGLDLVRWGCDGLAWHTALSGAFEDTAGTGQVFLMRGPLVLPQRGLANATPTLASASPSTITAGSGNLTLTVTGTNFVPGTVATSNGAERSTSFVDVGHLTVADSGGGREQGYERDDRGE